MTHPNPVNPGRSFGSGVTRFLQALTALFAVMFASAVLTAADAPKKYFDIPADNAEKSLKAFASQSDLEVLFVTEATNGVRTQAVRGEMTAHEALDKLLDGTPLVASENGKSGAVKIRREASLAEAEKNGASRPAKTDQAAATTEDGAIKLDTFEVFGKKTLNMDIQRTRDDVQPYVVFDRNTIQRSGASNVEDLLRTRVPMNSSSGTLGQFATSPSNLSQVNLRGLGSNQTLILVDGRRLPGVSTGTGQINPTSLSGESAQPDINGIPLSAIERIEILPSTAGGIYGGSATGGVINIVLRRDYIGAELVFAYGSTSDSKASSTSVSFSGGLTLEHGRTRVLLTATRSDSSPLLQGDRNFAQNARWMQLLNRPSAVATSNPPAGSLTNFKSANNTMLVLDNGTPYNAIFGSVPAGYSGVGSDNGTALLSRAGIYDQGMPNDSSSSGKQSSLLNNPTVISLGFNARREFYKSLEIFTDLSWSRNRGQVHPYAAATGEGNIVTLPASAPNNPFQQSLLVTFPSPGIVGSATLDAEAWKWQIGAILEPFKSWKLEADYGLAGSNSTNRTIGNGMLNLEGFTLLQNGGLDVMKDINQFPIDYSGYQNRVTSVSGPFDLKSENFSLRSGLQLEIFDRIPISISNAMELREDKLENGLTFSASNTASGPATNYAYVPGRSQRVESFYTEITGEFFRRKGRSLFENGVKTQTSVRYDQYQTRAPTPTVINSVTALAAPYSSLTILTNRVHSPSYTLGLSTSVVEGVLVRGSFSTGFLPPSLSQLSPFTSSRTFATTSDSTLRSIFGTDPKRGNTLVGRDASGSALPGAIVTKSVGNPELKPEDSRSYTLGIVIASKGIRGLRYSVDYTRIDKTNEIASITAKTVIANEDLIPGRVIRGANLASDLPGWSGPIQTVDASYLNFARTRMEAVDVQVDYAYSNPKTGATLTLYSIGTYNKRLERQLLFGQTAAEYVDSANGPLSLRGNLGFTFEKGDWLFGGNLQYYGSYSVVGATATAASAADSIATQGAARIPEQKYVDLVVTYKLPSRTYKQNHWELAFGVQNVFGTTPPFVAGYPGYSQYGDPRLRRYTLSLRWKSL